MEMEEKRCLLPTHPGFPSTAKEAERLVLHPCPVSYFDWQETGAVRGLVFPGSLLFNTILQ